MSKYETFIGKANGQPFTEALKTESLEAIDDEIKTNEARPADSKYPLITKINAVKLSTTSTGHLKANKPTPGRKAYPATQLKWLKSIREKLVKVKPLPPLAKDSVQRDLNPIFKAEEVKQPPTALPLPPIDEKKKPPTDEKKKPIVEGVNIDLAEAEFKRLDDQGIKGADQIAEAILVSETKRLDAIAKKQPSQLQNVRTALRALITLGSGLGLLRTGTRSGVQMTGVQPGAGGAVATEKLIKTIKPVSSVLKEMIAPALGLVGVAFDTLMGSGDSDDEKKELKTRIKKLPLIKPIPGSEEPEKDPIDDEKTATGVPPPPGPGPPSETEEELRKAPEDTQTTSLKLDDNLNTSDDYYRPEIVAQQDPDVFNIQFSKEYEKIEDAIYTQFNFHGANDDVDDDDLKNIDPMENPLFVDNMRMKLRMMAPVEELILPRDYIPFGSSYQVSRAVESGLDFRLPEDPEDVEVSARTVKEMDQNNTYTSGVAQRQAFYNPFQTVRIMDSSQMIEEGTELDNQLSDFNRVYTH